MRTVICEVGEQENVATFKDMSFNAKGESADDMFAYMLRSKDVNDARPTTTITCKIQLFCNT